MRRRVFAFAVVGVIAFSISDVAFAQSRGGAMAGMGSSAFSSGSGMGGFGSGFGGSGFGSGFGGSGFGGGGIGSGGFGSGGFGSGFGGIGGGGFGNTFGRGGGFGNSGFGNSGYGGGQYGGGQAFVGRDASDMQATFMQSNRASTQFFNNMNRQMSRNNRNNRRSTTTTNQNPPQPMRVEVRAAFTAPQPTSDAVAARLRTRLTKILADHHMTQPNLTMQGDTVVISGTAASDSERQVIANLIALEPGVRAVRNEMTLAGEPSVNIVPAPGG
jgi:hypothetical protein